MNGLSYQRETVLRPNRETQALAAPDPIVTPQRVFKFMTAAGILYVGALILSPFPYYLPPDFSRGFLRSKGDFFFSSGYFVGFYAHILTAPIGLLIGTLQFSSTLRQRWPQLHRQLGRTYVWLVLIGVAPGGIIMATKAYGGLSSTICFSLIGILMWYFTWQAWREARAMRFRKHAQWMCRSYTLMCSAIMLRLISFALEHVSIDHTFRYQLSVWLSWVPAMIALEIAIRFAGRVQR